MDRRVIIFRSLVLFVKEHLICSVLLIRRPITVSIRSEHLGRQSSDSCLSSQRSARRLVQFAICRDIFAVSLPVRHAALHFDKVFGNRPLLRNCFRSAIAVLKVSALLDIDRVTHSVFATALVTTYFELVNRHH